MTGYSEAELFNKCNKLEIENKQQNEQLTKAKEIIKEYLEWADWKGSNCPSFANICQKAEAFLKE